jgi:membrane protease YdiL (CAAX protease family)
MKISLKRWIIFGLLALLSLGLWYKLEYSRLSFIDLSVDKKEAVSRARSYLATCGVDPKDYLTAVIFHTDDWSDRYLQRTLGLESGKFIQEHKLELFAWQVRFFKERQKEEYVLRISAQSGEVLAFSHLIEDIEARDTPDKARAERKAREFLRSHYGLRLEGYEFNSEKAERLDQRTDYIFSWKKKGVYVPWEKTEGGAKLLIGATVSGKEIRAFYKDTLEVPEKFRRYIANQFVQGDYLFSLHFLVFVILVSWAVFLVIKRKNHVAINACKKSCVYLAAFIFVINLAAILNSIQAVLMGYDTSAPMSSYLGSSSIKFIINGLFVCIIFVFPALAGESLHDEKVSLRKSPTLLYYVKSNLFNRGVAVSIILGYLLFLVLLGFQAGIFYLGQKYCGVWKEWTKLTHFSSAYLPFLSAFILGANASLIEEVIFRLFAINLLRRRLKKTILVVLLTALVWGFGHSGYAIFPFWFRAIEVTLMGFIFGYMFVYYGLIAVVVGHYLFDVFLGVAPYILGESNAYLFISSLFILLIPLFFAGIAYIMNRPQEQREIKRMLDAAQTYNLNILLAFVALKKSQGFNEQDLRRELMSHNWDSNLIDLAIKEAFGR